MVCSIGYQTAFGYQRISQGLQFAAATVAQGGLCDQHMQECKDQSNLYYVTKTRLFNF